MAAISKVRESMTDAALIEALEAQTGRAYSKFTISRYFSDDAPTTTLELTMDLWATFGQRHGIPRPFIIAETRAEAEKLSPLGGDVERAGIMRDLRKLDAELKAREAERHPEVIGSNGGEEKRRESASNPGGGGDPLRRRQSRITRS